MLMEIDKAEHIVSRDEAVLLSEFEQFLDLFADATKYLQSVSQPTINLMFATSCSIKKM